MRLRHEYAPRRPVPVPLGGESSPKFAAQAGQRPRTARARWLRSKNWDEHVDDLEQMADTPGFRLLRDRILELAALRSSDRVLDIGAGTGLLTLAAASSVDRVWALDSSSAMCRELERKLDRLKIANVEVLHDSATGLPLPDEAVDVVLSNYCFHHLDDAAKRRALAEIARVMRPGGRLVFGDMMFRVGITNRRDREVMALLLTRMIRRGPAGLLRLLKNAIRIAAGRWDHPSSGEWWRGALLEAGFNAVDVQALQNEGGIAVARRPGHVSPS